MSLSNCRAFLYVLAVRINYEIERKEILLAERELVRIFGSVFAIMLFGAATLILEYRTRNSADADKPRDAFRGQPGSSNMAPFDMLDMLSY